METETKLTIQAETPNPETVETPQVTTEDKKEPEEQAPKAEVEAEKSSPSPSDIIQAMTRDSRVGHFLSELLAGSTVERAASFLIKTAEKVTNPTPEPEKKLGLYEQLRLPGTYDPNDDEQGRDITHTILRRNRRSVWGK